MSFLVVDEANAIQILCYRRMKREGRYFNGLNFHMLYLLKNFLHIATPLQHNAYCFTIKLEKGCFFGSHDVVQWSGRITKLILDLGCR